MLNGTCAIDTHHHDEHDDDHGDDGGDGGADGGDGGDGGVVDPGDISHSAVATTSVGALLVAVLIAVGQQRR